MLNVEPSLPDQVRREAARHNQQTRQDGVTEVTSPGQLKSQEVNERYAVLADQEKDTPGLLPWWFVYIGFILVFVTTNTAAFFVMLYTFEFGREKTEAWLLIFLTSFLSDLILIQPVKILAMAAMFAVCFKKANKGEEGKRCDLKQCEDIAKDQKQIPPVPDPAGSPDLAQARMVAIRRRKLGTILKEVAVYALFLAVVMLAAYGQKNHMAFHMSNEVQRLVVHNEDMNFEEVSDADSYWTWLEDAALPSLYPDASPAVPDLPVYRVGPVRLRQARVRLDPVCLTTVSPGNQTSECDRRYDFFSQDEGNYGEGWLPLPTVNITAFNGTNGTAVIPGQNSTSPWRFRSSDDLQELPYAGDHNVYFGGGYVADMSDNSSKTMTTIQALKIHGWIDRATRAVFTDVTLYSPDSNLFSIVTLLVEFTAIGAGFPRWEVHTVCLYRFHGGWEVWMALVYISALAVFTLVFAIREVRKAYNSGVLYIMDFWNWVELIIILQALAGVATFFYSEAVLEDVANTREDGVVASFDENSGLSGRFVNYRRAAVWDQVYTYVIATLLCSVTLKMTHLLRFNHRASLLIHTLKRSVGPLSGFSAMFFLYFFAFAILLHLTFGLRMLSYSFFARTFEAMVTIIAGDLNYEEISTTTGNLGTFILFLFVFVFNICLIGFFVAIIDESYHSAKEDEGLEKTDYDLKGFFKYQLQNIKPKKKAKEPSNENTDIMGPGYAELKVNVMKRLRTVFEDLDES
ncbi:polycystic kidney disease protein 1-like 2 [Branchiostoma floridae]|uniref:Polycystic kidney disease protein 1-like 2 n=1 Tax=Branchiostoma floridae TaxID=7739 RepID=A0A9J7MJA6_BRAFL|nr:polycystic kidney disease protein 1-like 2 [Branchiostoma floridae]